MTSYPFLSAEWVDAARALRDEYAGRVPAAPVTARVNVIVTDVPHGDAGSVEGHIDTSTGQTVIDHGHVDDPELTVTVDYDTAKAAFVTRDQQAVMTAFITGKILVDGDASKLLALQSGPLQPGVQQDIDPVLVELYHRLDELTDKDA